MVGSCAQCTDVFNRTPGLRGFARNNGVNKLRASEWLDAPDRRDECT